MAAAFISALDAEENKDSQRQPSAVSRQIGNNTVVKSFAGKSFAAAEECNQAGEVDRQSPGELDGKIPWANQRRQSLYPYDGVSSILDIS